jgi:hypothetical protein
MLKCVACDEAHANCHKLVPPYGAAQPVVLTVQPSVGHAPGGHITVSWIPSSADTSALNNWSPAYAPCAQHNIQIAT